MKKFLAILLCSCRLFAGEGVGNGDNENPYQPVFLLASAKFYVRMEKSLKVSRPSDTQTTVDNSPLVKQAEPVSSVKFELLNNNPSYSKIKTIEAVRDYLKQNSKRDWQEFTLPGAIGFMSETKSSSHLRGFYFILTNNADFIRAVVDADSSADGIKLVGPIVHTFTYDVTPPTILEMKIDGSSEFSPGQKGRILFRITDDYSGVTATINQPVVSSFYTGGLSSGKWFQVMSHLKRLGNDWYFVDFTVAANAEAGEYVFSGIGVTDNAKNIATALSFENLPYYTTSDHKPLEHLPLLKINVKNSGPIDRGFPAISGIKAQSNVVKAGEDLKLMISLPSCGSKCQKKTNDLGANMIPGSWVGFTAPIAHSPTAPFTLYGLGIFDQDVSGSDQLGVTWYTDLGLEGGKYYVARITLFDEFRNARTLWADDNKEFYVDEETKKSTQIPVIKFDVLPDDRPDKNPPTIHAVKVVGDFKLGSKTAAVLINATDDSSGIDPTSHIYGSFVPTSPSDTNLYFDVGNEWLEHKVYRDMAYSVITARTPYKGDDWYMLVPDFNEYLPPGEYYLKEIHVSDKAKNYRILRASLKDGFYHFEDRSGHDAGPTDIPVVKINLER